jgi:hypothetical protein
VSNFLGSTVDGFLEDVVERADTDPAKDMRLAAVQRCVALKGSRTVERWRESAASYPDELVETMVRRALTDDVPCVSASSPCQVAACDARQADPGAL